MYFTSLVIWSGKLKVYQGKAEPFGKVISLATMGSEKRLRQV